MEAAPIHTRVSATRAMLHLTNGSAIIPKMRAVGLAGSIVPWDDVLHEGPVPAGLNVAALREVRAEFLAVFADMPRDVLMRELTNRDNALDAALNDGAAPVDEVVLWFEHDLYDQLHLLQILDRIPADRAPVLTAVPDDDYLGVQATAQFPGLFAARRPITSGERLAARDAWDAFRAADPRAVVEAIPRVSALRHVGPAFKRHLQQFPSLHNGLSRSEQQALEAMASGVTRVKDIYLASNHQRESPIFMSDSAFVYHMSALHRTTRPLVTPFSSLDGDTQLTDDGGRVLNGEADRVALCGIDRWLGGVHLTGHGAVWRWDAERDTVRLC